jgi:adenosylcobinamide-GDP ribazoletransferase
VSAFVDAVGFLTRVPVGSRPQGAPPSSAVRWFPVVGALVGGVGAVVYWAGAWLAGPLVGAVLSVGAQVVVTGAFHEDGLADTADASGGWSREERFRILDDPNHGTYGVVTVAIVLLLRAACLAALTPAAAFAILPAAHALSRGAAVALMGLVPPASDSGLGASSVRNLTGADAAAGTGAAVAIAVVLLLAWSLPAAAVVAAVGAVMAAYARRTIGGVAGDLLGATQQLADAAALVVLAGAVRHGAAIPWWR